MVHILNKECGTTGYGLMAGFHMPPAMSPEKAIPIMKHALNQGANIWAAAEHYGTADYNSLHLLHDYFTQYPEDSDRVVLSLKTGFDVRTMTIHGDEDAIRASFQRCENILAGTKKIDILACSRVDPKVPVEITINAINKFVKAGKVGGVGLSECSAATLLRASKICKIAAIEVEFSLFTPDLLSNGVLTAAQEVGTAVIAYSPIGRGFLTGSIMSIGDLAENDLRRRLPRFAEEAIGQNAKLVREVQVMAQRKDVTVAQIALAWIRAHSNDLVSVVPIPGSVNLTRIEENTKDVLLDASERLELDEAIRNNPVVGNRYPGAVNDLNWG